jgi:hypothetical protein
MPEHRPADVAQAASESAARPLSISVAGGILIVTGVFAGTIGLVLLVVALVNTDRSSLPDYLDAVPEGFAGPAAAIGLLLVAYGAGQTVAGVQAIRAREWARGAGITLALMGALVLGFAMLAPTWQEGSGAVPVIFAPIIGALIYSAAALASEGRWFGLREERAGDRG